MIKHLRFFLFVLLFVSFCYISIFHPLIPITYDEAWNFTDLSRHGPIYAITRYPFPNNHVFFTVLQSVLTPIIILFRSPYILRLINVVICTLLFYLLFLLFSKTLHKQITYSLVVIATFSFISPLITPYFIVGRGYILGSLLLATGIYLLSQKKYVYAVIPFAISVWTVPTFLYTLPFLYFLVLLFNKKHDWLFVGITGMSVVVVDFFLYFPILKNIFASTNMWTSYSFSAFFSDTIVSISNYSFVPYGIWLNYLYIVIYVISILLIFFHEKRSSSKHFFIYLNTAILSYLFIIWLLSQFQLAHPPFMRNGLFIPIVVFLTIFYGITFISTRICWVAWSILLGNVLIGVYLFATQLPYNPTNPYPYLMELSPLSKNQKELLNEIKNGKIIVDQSNDGAVLNYYSILYKIPLVEFVPAVSSPSMSLSSVNKVTTGNRRPNKTMHTPSILPDSLLYIGKRLWQQITLKSYDLFVLSKKPKIRYLLALSDETYAESLILWNKGKKDLAIQTIPKAENYITLMTPEVHTLSNYGNIDNKLYEEIRDSIDQHLEFLSNFLLTATKSEKQTLLAVQTIATNNLETITFLIGK